MLSKAGPERRIAPLAIRSAAVGNWVAKVLGVAGFLLLASLPATAADRLAEHYRLAGEHDVASQLVLQPDGKFEYDLASGALDEHAEGRWRRDGMVLHLTTVPVPVAPIFTAGAASATAEAPLVLHVTAPNGAGIAGVDLRVGFDTGEAVEGYTQDYGWSLQREERRKPRWVEFAIPMYMLSSPRFPIAVERGTALTFVLTPNDIGIVDFAKIIIDVEARGLVVHRGQSRLVYEVELPEK